MANFLADIPQVSVNHAIPISVFINTGQNTVFENLARVIILDHDISY